MQEANRKTEKFLFGAFSILLLVLVFNFYTNEPDVTTQVASADSQGGGSGDDEGNSGDSANSEDEKSEASAQSTPSEKSVPSVQSAKSRATSVSAKSEASTSQQGLSVASVNDETGQLSAESVKSLKSEDSSIATVSTEGNVSIVKREGKLLFLIPVDIESQITTNETGTVIAEKTNFLNWLKAIFSF